MKRTTVLVMLVSIITLSLAQSCKSKRNTDESGTSPEVGEAVTGQKQKIYEHKNTVKIYLASVKLIDADGNTSYHLAMFDANGDFAVDSLRTVYTRLQGSKSGHIKWKLVQQSGIETITEFIPVLGESSKIFQNDVNQETESKDEWNLDLPEDILGNADGQELTEKYIIKYIPEGYNDTVEIDPYIRLP